MPAYILCLSSEIRFVAEQGACEKSDGQWPCHWQKRAHSLDPLELLQILLQQAEAVRCQ